MSICAILWPAAAPRFKAGTVAYAGCDDWDASGSGMQFLDASDPRALLGSRRGDRAVRPASVAAAIIDRLRALTRALHLRDPR